MESIRHKIALSAVGKHWIPLRVTLLITAIFGYGLLHVEARTIYSGTFPMFVSTEHQLMSKSVDGLLDGPTHVAVNQANA